MIFEVQNLGNINHAKIDLSKNLILFTGQNNTGKTYLSYAIYGLSHFYEDQPNEYLSNKLIELYDSKNIEIDLRKVFTSLQYSKSASYYYKRHLGDIFGLDQSSFDASTFELYWNSEEELQQKLYLSSWSGRMSSTGPDLNHNLRVSFLKEAETYALKVSCEDTVPTNIGLDDLNKYVYNRTPLIDKYNFISVERTGIAIFGKDVIMNRFAQSNLPNPISTTQYSQIIQNSIREQEYLSSYIKRYGIGTFNDLALELEEKILGGKLEVSAEGDVFLKINGKEIKMQLVGSAIKSLSSLAIYLRYHARENAAVIIDEPEINLHPDNQRVVARILAKMVNRGIKVIVSTHSDYIIRELNHLMIMSAHKENPDVQKIMAQHGYEATELVSPADVGAYLFTRNDDLTADVTKLEIDPIDGIQPDTINKVINQQNQISKALYNRLFAELA